MGTPLFHLLLAIHLVAGTGALVSGLPPLFVRKGEAAHRRWGRLFAGCMVVVIATAVCMTALAWRPYFAALTLAAALTAFSSVRVLRRKRPDVRHEDRARALDWIVAVTGLTGAIGLGLMAATGRAGGNPTVVWSLVGVSLTYSLWDLYRFSLPAAWPMVPRLWLFEHLVKMLGAYGAVVGAFSGSVAAPWLPDPWKQLWSTILFLLLTAVFAWRHARPSAQDARPALA